MSQKLVVVRGAACSGKTTICEKLRDFDKKIVWLSIDRIIPIFIDYNDDVMDEVNRSVLVILRDLLNRNYSVVIDGIFKKPNHINQIIKIGKDSNIKTIIYQLEASLEVLKKRDKERESVKQWLWKPLGEELIEDIYKTVENNPIEEVIKLNTEELSPDEIANIIRKDLVD